MQGYRIGQKVAEKLIPIIVNDYDDAIYIDINDTTLTLPFQAFSRLIYIQKSAIICKLTRLSRTKTQSSKEESHHDRNDAQKTEHKKIHR